MSKKKQQQKHFKSRALQRYDVDITPELSNLWMSYIQDNISVCLDRQSDRVSVHLIKHNEEFIPIVYDKYRKQIVTCLPQTYLNGFDSKIAEYIKKENKRNKVDED
jgi:hypothetical protein